MKIEFYKHNVSETDIAALSETLRGTFLTTGPKTAEFETALAAHLDLPGAVGLNSCTSALFLSLKAWGIGPGDEVIVPAMTFVATALAVLHTGATCVLCDVNPHTALMDIEDAAARVTPRTKAVIPVHLYGQMVDIELLQQTLAHTTIRILEDSAHGITPERNGIRPAHKSDAACFSFYATKNITSGEGGAVVSRDLEFLQRIRTLRTFGMTKSAADRYHRDYQHWDVTELGYKANMPDIQAALLVNQLKRLEALREQRENICLRYEKAFAAEGIEFPVVESAGRSARHLFTVWFPANRRDQSIRALQERGLGIAVNYRSLTELSYIRQHVDCNGLPVSDEIGRRTISIPMYPKLSDDEIDFVIQSVIDVYHYS